ncbi:MAG TPA: hypothetical protein VFM69_02470 [Pricia sp.]|nr:hypothetical protein [Pricia sp.]
MGKFNVLIGFLTFICTAQAQDSASQRDSATGPEFVSFGETMNPQQINHINT